MKKIIIWQAIKELIALKKLSLKYILNLTIGLLAFVLLNSFQSSLIWHINKKSTAITGADLSIKSQEELPKKDLLKINLFFSNLTKGEYRHSIKKEVSSMVRKDTNYQSQLSRINFIQDNYPLKSEIILEGIDDYWQKLRELKNKQEAWIQPQLAKALNLKLNDIIKIGQLNFKVTAFITEDPESMGFMGQISPKIYVSDQYFSDSKLQQIGSRISYDLLYSIDKKYSLAELKNYGEKLNKWILENLPQYNFSLSSHIQNGERISTLMSYLIKYMGLITLISYYLAGIGLAYLFNNFIKEKRKSIAIMKSLGSGEGFVLAQSILQILTLSTIASLFSWLISLLLIPVFPEILKGILPDGFEVIISSNSLIVAFCMGIFGSLIFSIPGLISINQIQPISLLNENFNSEIHSVNMAAKKKNNFKAIIYFISCSY